MNLFLSTRSAHVPIEFCDEVVVIDDNSSDDTVKIAEKLGATVYIRKLNSNFAQQRNFGLKKASGIWVLFVDADERISKNLADEISKAVKTIILRNDAARIASRCCS